MQIVSIADEAGLTPLAHQELFPDPLANLSKLELMKDHSITFFRAIGFTMMGVLPEAIGRGKHLFRLGRKIT